MNPIEPCEVFKSSLVINFHWIQNEMLSGGDRLDKRVFHYVCCYGSKHTTPHHFLKYTLLTL